MTVQPRAGKTLAGWLGRVGITIAVALGVSAVVATPAHAAPTDVSIAVSGNVNLTVGGTGQRVTFTVTNRARGDADNLVVRIDVPLGGEGVHINAGPDGCEVGRNSLRCGIARLRGGESEQLMIRIAPPPSGGPAPGDSRSGQGQARVEFREDLDPGNNAAAFNVTLNGAEQNQSVASVAGTVKDSESDKPIANAKVVVTDGDGNPHKTATDDSGQFRVTSDQTNPIAAGSMKITISKDGYETRIYNRTPTAGASVTISARLIKKADPEASTSAAPDESDPAAAEPSASAAATEEGGGFMIWVLYLLAGLLVLGGIGAIVWLFARRKEDEDSDRFGPPGPHGPHGPGPHGPHGPQPIGAQGVYHDPYGQPTQMMGGAQPTQMLGGGPPTAVMGPGGMGPGGMGSPGGMGQAGFDQPTSMLPRAGLDQPTSLVNRPGLDQPTSLVNRPGLDQPTSMVNRPGLDQPTSMISRSSVDEPTQAHPGPAADDDVYPQGRERYASGTSGHGYGDPSYGRDRYGDPGPVSPGYSNPGPVSPGYGNPGPVSPSYGNPGPVSPGHGGGAAGYGGGYGQSGGYPQGGGYGQDPGHGVAGQGYGEQGYGEQQPRHPRRAAEDRRLDWYED